MSEKKIHFFQPMIAHRTFCYCPTGTGFSSRSRYVDEKHRTTSIENITCLKCIQMLQTSCRQQIEKQQEKLGLLIRQELRVKHDENFKEIK